MQQLHKQQCCQKFSKLWKSNCAQLVVVLLLVLLTVAPAEAVLPVNATRQILFQYFTVLKLLVFKKFRQPSWQKRLRNFFDSVLN
uniref:Uncharacterized protein n=1 Tax=Rhodnius prolixus TaxID=13249 RepID=T1HET9_RHOPR